MTIQQWSTTPANNANGVTNVNMATGSAPSTVHPSVRQMMADVATWYASAEWLVQADTPTFVSGTQFTVTGNRTSVYSVNRRVQATGSGAMGTIAGTISVSAFTSVTTVTVVWDSGALDATLTTVAVGIIQASGLNAALLTGTTLPALSGVNLTNLNATNLASGTVNTARVAGSYAGITGVGTLAGLTMTGALTANSASTSQNVYDLEGGDSTYFALKNNSRAANNKNWLWLLGSDASITLRAYDDALSSSAVALQVTRSGASITGVTVGGPLDVQISSVSQWKVDSSGRLLNGAATQPFVHAINSASRTTTGVFDTFTENIDQGSNFNNATGVFTCPVAGTYLVMGVVGIFSLTAQGSVTVSVRKNGTGQYNASYVTVNSATPGTPRYPFLWVITGAASDTVDLNLASVSGTGCSVQIETYVIRQLG